jgi:hypothetical protein
MSGDHHAPAGGAKAGMPVLRYAMIGVPIAIAVVMVILGISLGVGSHHGGPPPGTPGAAAQGPSVAPGRSAETQVNQSGCPAATDTQWNYCTYKGTSSGILAGKAGMRVCFDQPLGKDQPSTRQRWDSESSTHWVDWPDVGTGTNPDILRFRFVGNDPSELVTNGYRLLKPGETCPEPGA